MLSGFSVVYIFFMVYSLEKVDVKDENNQCVCVLRKKFILNDEKTDMIHCTCSIQQTMKTFACTSKDS